MMSMWVGWAGIKRMMRIGYRYAQRLHESGDLPELHSIRKRPEP
jgi:hypothetical protein